MGPSAPAHIPPCADVGQSQRRCGPPATSARKADPTRPGPRFLLWPKLRSGAASHVLVSSASPVLLQRPLCRLALGLPPSASPVQQQLNVPQPNGRTRARHAGWQADEGEVKAESLRSGCELGALQRLLCAKNPARCANLCPVCTRCGSARLVALWALVGRVVGLVAAATLNFALANKPDEAKVTAG